MVMQRAHEHVIPGSIPGTAFLSCVEQGTSVMTTTDVARTASSLGWCDTASLPFLAFLNLRNLMTVPDIAVSIGFCSGPR